MSGSTDSRYVAVPVIACILSSTIPEVLAGHPLWLRAAAAGAGAGIMTLIGLWIVRLLGKK